MKEKFLVMFSMLILLFIVVVPIVFASSPFVIGEEKAGGYQYTVIKEQNSFTWKIGHQGNISTIVENMDNKEDLEHFRTAVEDVNMDIFEIILSASYFLIVVITTLIFYKKTKQIPKSSGAIIAILAGIAVYYTIENSINLNTALQDAKFYYSMLTS
ncbi:MULTISPECIES: geobacillin-26 family protein [unclassified Cytobacillus]|uniref:geobacillin-26 family protein n=1 Tax=unclassified Cytobacillus TaxID=2675268 RepID=UPI002041B2AD|nr:geobacillin-26 family protein [Cytobacillus sp. AMY 15.2]MCM3094352.1 geobacillin-26 family protein [Cytobacillus sp. AMY 15.2]